MKRPNVALVTTTFYKDIGDIRFGLALKTIAAAKKEGYPIHIVDGSPNLEIREALREAGALVLREEVRGIGASRRQCFQLGLNSGADVIVWLEPEKYPFVPLIKECVDEMFYSDWGENEIVCDILVPGRRNLEGYPRYQELSELRANRSMGISSGRPDVDWMFGPRVLSREAAKLFLTYTGQAGGDTYHILNVPILWALSRSNGANDMLVDTKIVDYVHPPEQTAAEVDDPAMDKKRDDQRHLLEDLVRDQARLLGLESVH